LTSCIGDDFIDDEVDPVLKISNPIDSLAIDSSYQFEFMYLNNVGIEELVEVEWSSTNENVIAVDNTGKVTALDAGNSIISVEYMNGGIAVEDSQLVGVGERTVVSSTSKSGKVATTSSYKLTGSFTISQEGSNLNLVFAEDYEASTALPGLYVYLSNNPSTTNEAYEIQAVEVFKGAHSYIIEDVQINDYRYVLYFCKPFNVKVGHGEIND
jgi:hypothetical protein